jgi:hypothetical protein
MTNVNVTATEVAPLGGATNCGMKLGWIDSGAKAAQNDTWTVTNATEVLWACVTTDADGVADPVTISTNVLTLTSATATAGSGFIIYRG